MNNGTAVSISHIHTSNSSTQVSKQYLIIKRILDIIFSSAGVVVLFPVFVVITYIIRLTSKGPAIYKHKRVGLNGKAFNCLKFRTMVSDADNLEKYLTPEQLRQFKTAYKLDNDPRVTKFGRFLRRTSIDEFLQFLNILKGDMSFVGPRPVTYEELEKYGDNAKLCFSVKPGLTGMWQVNGRSETTYEKRVMLDINYVDSPNIFTDLKLMLRSLSVVLSRKGAV